MRNCCVAVSIAVGFTDVGYHSLTTKTCWFNLEGRNGLALGVKRDRLEVEDRLHHLAGIHSMSFKLAET